MSSMTMRAKAGGGRIPIHIARFLFSLVRCWVARRQTKQCLNITTLFLAYTQGRRFNVGPTRVTTGNAGDSWHPTIRASQYPPRCNLHRHVNALSGCFRLQVPKEQKHCRRSHPSIPGMDSNSRALGQCTSHALDVTVSLVVAELGHCYVENVLVRSTGCSDNTTCT